MKNVKNSFIPQFPYGQVSHLKFETPKKQSKLKLTTPPKYQSGQTIPKALFNNINVSIMIPNPETTNIVKNALISAGANVFIGNSNKADIVISESQQIIQPQAEITPRKTTNNHPIATVSAVTPKSNSSKLLLTPSTNNDEKTFKKSPRNIFLNQIPWIFENDTKLLLSSRNRSVNNSSTSVTNQIFEPKPVKIDDSTQNILIISDIFRRFRPIATKIKYRIELHYGKVPKAYHITPFDPIPPMVDELMKKYQEKLLQNRVKINPEPANNGFCCICQIPYENAETHHHSKTHNYNASLEDWSEFDQLSIEINSMFLNSSIDQ